ncbi:DNL zinc finger domain-containing [Cryptosporidium sp. chipmunk genotype I]|uniref:DNL zinc finger domain-containing n=1 Tax=Cryptosporidium sp. chipmunk genotype I TaxID=1280935 RepID=UPI003519FFF1|nr:DNL zinc finger domain-containing [Cryptosporidium sp. chipmunk genotype I]
MIQPRAFLVTRRTLASSLPLLTRRLLFKSGGGILERVRSGLWIANIFGSGLKMPILSKRPVSTTSSKLTGDRMEIKSKLACSNFGNNGLKDNQEMVDLNKIQGTLDYGEDGLYVFSCLCKVCNSKITKKFGKKAYNEGVVIIRCDNCKNHHLVSDKLGWFGDNRDNFDVFKFLNNKEISVS